MITRGILDWESHLIQKAALGDTIAFELLADTYRPVLHSLAIRMLRNSDDANDVVQETLVKAFRAIKDFDPERPIRPWLCRICSNCCVDAVRSRRRDGEPLDAHEYMLVDPAADADDQVTSSIDHERVVEAVENLPAKYRKIIFMRHFQHKDVMEIALELDKPEGTIKSWLFRARALLRKDLAGAVGL